jgi:ectoine hydroxylase-related dioxygenase (phytanoyl-CoA dioxygenase family)
MKGSAMPEQVTIQEDLRRDLGGRYKALTPSKNRRSSQIDADFDALMRDGYVIVPNLLTSSEVARIKGEAQTLLGSTGRNSFEGHATQRVYNVLAKTRGIDRAADHPRVMGLLDKLFLPNYLLSQTQIINILPGEAAQLLHYDDAFYGWPRPRPPLGAAIIIAIDDFLEDNGATVIIPGSHLWGQDVVGSADQTIPAIMPAGSAIIFLGTTWHGGGANRSTSSRLAVTCQYCEPYLRQQENFLLELSEDVLLKLTPELRAMVGYSIHPPFMGMVDGKHPLRTIAGLA